MIENKVLVNWSTSPGDEWTIEDAFKGVAVMGGTGSGKTTTSGKLLASKYLRQGWGGLVLCAKSDEADLWRRYCADNGRTKDLIVFGNDSVIEDVDSEYYGQLMMFNPIQYEMQREGKGGGDTMNITNIFMNIYRMGNRIAGEGDTKEERYWDTALKRCLNRTIELIKLSGENLTYSNMVKLLVSTSNLDENKFEEEHAYIQDNDDFSRLDRDDNYCIKCLIKAYYINFKGKTASMVEENAYNLVYDYFLNAIPNMGSRTRGIVMESFMGLAEPFLSGLLFKHFAGETNLRPEETYEKGKIIVLDFSVKDYLDSGITAQCVFKLLFQQAIERRNPREFSTPVFLWADEAQYFINPYDQIFLTTARSSMAATVFLSQNISNYLAVMGSGGDAKARVDSLMGNLSTKIFHANSDAETNEYASRLLGNEVLELKSVSNSQKFMSLEINQSHGVTASISPQVQAMKFTTLKTGGNNKDEKLKFIVEAYIFTTGKEWSTGKNYLKAIFKQDFKS